MLRHTKIVATLGPASSDLATLERLVQSGVDVVRLNFSHGTAEDHIKRANQIRDAAQLAGGNWLKQVLLVVNILAVGIANTYYYGRLLEKNPNLNVGIFWANQKTSGTHVNISGAGVVNHAKHKEAAVKFLEWLSSSKAQGMFADANLEFPVNPEVKPNTLVNQWGSFKPNLINVSQAGKGQVEAVKLMDRAGYQ